MNKGVVLFVVKLSVINKKQSNLLNRIMMNKNVILKNVLFLLMAFFVFTGCQKDDTLTPQQQYEEQHTESRFARNQIDFKTLKSKISDPKVLEDIERKMHKNAPKSGGTNEFILYIDTSRIIEYSNDSISTYTMTVITSDQDTEKFTNIVLKEDKGEVTTYLMRYTPTEQWKEDALNGEKGPFSGVISILNNDGVVLFEAEVEDYMEINSTSFSTCSATIEPMVYCLDPDNPNPYVCVCGISFVVGYVVVYGEDCLGNGGGPNDDPFEGGIPGSGGGEGDGGSTGPGNPGEFPTEPNFDYMLIHNLNALLQPPLTFQQEEWIMANEGNYQFGLWTLSFLASNPNLNISWNHIQNWFINTPNFVEPNLNINPDNITYDEPLIQQDLPSLVDFVNNFPKYGTSGNYSEMPTSAVYNLVGGSLLTSHLNNPNAYSNACSIRGSRALLYSGIHITILNYSGVGQRTQKGGDELNYILDAVSFNKFMNDKFGAPTYFLEGTSANNSAQVANLLNGKNGIYVIINNSHPQAGYSGHVDAIIDGVCISGAYTTPPGGVKSISIWELE